MHHTGKLNLFGACAALAHKVNVFSSLTWCLWLADVLQALHSGTSLNFLSSELWTTLPSSQQNFQQNFQQVYRTFLQSEDNVSTQNAAIFLDSNSQEDAILLLVAVLSDSICVRRSLGQIVLMADSADAGRHNHNPYVPLSPHTELDRMQDFLSRALDQWQRTFRSIVSAEAMALYHYCRLYLSCPKLLDLSRLAGYKPFTSKLSPQLTTSSSPIGVSDESMRHSWLVLDNAAVRSNGSDTLCPAWVPIVVFHASLVVWAKLSLTEGSKSDTYGSTKVLLAFKAELEKMEWPCCVEMVATLDKLMSQPIRKTVGE